MIDRSLLYDFWNCGDGQIIEFALVRARLNRHEREVVHFMLDECMTQEEVAEAIHYSTRRTQEFWYSASRKLLDIPWVMAYAVMLREKREL